MLMVGEVLWMNDGGWGRNPEPQGQAEVFCAKLFLTPARGSPAESITGTG